MVKPSEDEISPVESYDLVGGAMALDLVNTVTSRTRPPYHDRLRSYGDLVTWGERVADVSPEEAAALREQAAANPAAAEEALVWVRTVRDAIYSVFAARHRGERPNAMDLDVLNRAYAEAVAHRKLECAAEGVDFCWQDSLQLTRPLWPAAIDALDLLVSDQATRVKECATDNCNWLFLDASKNRSRRWCEMRECGNRAKARRHYHKKKQTP